MAVFLDTPLRVLVAAENLLIRTGLTTLLTTQTDVDVVGQVSGDEGLADDLEVYRPDVVLYDLGYQPLSALSRLEALTGIPFVVLTPTPEDGAAVVGVMEENAVYGLLLRDTPPPLIATALYTVYQGLVVLDPTFTGLLSAPESLIPEPLPESLTARELEVLQLLAEGLPNKLIAQRLAISPNTVKFHINAILSKLSVQSRTEAVIRATRLGLVIL
jgi:two-component system, NarL family, nitrate/nitrite response regulator NarL